MSQNSKILEIVIKAKDEATSTLKGLSTTLEKQKHNFESLAIAGTAAFAGITAVVATSVKAYAESERSQRQLEHAIIGVSKGTAEQVQQINELTAALQKKAGIDGDALNAGVAQLSTFGLQTKSVVDLSKSLADLTVNQKGAAAGADDYISSANIMAKALRGEFGLLEKMGIRFTEHQQELINTGTEQQKVATIVEGFAQNLRETTDTVSGYDRMMGQLRGTIGDVQEAIGAGLQPVFQAISNTIIPIIQRIGEWTTKNSQLAATLFIMGGVLTGLVASLAILGLAMPAIIAFFAALASPVGLVVTGIGLLSSAFIGLGMNIGNVQSMLSTFISENDLLRTSIDWLKMSFTQIALYFQEVFLPVWAEFVAAIAPWKPYFEAFAQVIGVVLVGSLVALVTILGGLSLVIIQLLKWFTQLATVVSGLLVSAFQGLQMVVEGVAKWIERVISLAQKAVDAVKKIGGGSSKSGGKREFGGPVQMGKEYLVGENGPELFSPTANGSIVPNNKLAGAGGFSLTINLNGGTYLSDEVAESIGDRIIQNFKRTAKI